MAKRKEGSFPIPASNKRLRQEDRYDSDDEGEPSLLQSESNANSQLVSGEVGIIERIQLKNFMCHSMLGPFNFGSNINFILGNNGSGKSAILTALIVGLGGKAIVTNRGSSLKDFVKDGQSSADVSITLRNRGDDAFKPECYGDSITINQHISVEGHRSYKLKSSTGVLVSSKKEELTAILDHFNIQVDNPISVLTQEMSKLFLQSKNEADKYKFFMKATQLEQMKEDYSHIMETKARTHDQIAQGEEFLEELKKQYLVKEERYKSIAAMSEMQNELKVLQHQIAWAMVIEYTEKEIKTIRDDIAAQEARTAKFVEKVKEWQVNVAEVEHTAMQDKLQKITEEAQTLQPSCNASKTEIKTKRKAYNDAEVYRKKPHDPICEFLWPEKLKETARISEPEKLEKQNRIDHLKEQLKMLHDQNEAVGQEIKQFQEAVRTYEEEHSRLKREEHELKQVLDQQQRQLKELKESKTNRLKRFGQYMPDLCDAIEKADQQRQFVHKPIGPLGAFIHLKDAELALGVEACLKSLVLAFCCDNYKDERVLQTLMSKFCKTSFRPQIIVSSFRSNVYDVRLRSAVHPEFPSVLTALNIDNAVVANCLIDMRSIERVLLIKNNSEARRVMQQNKPPNNCKEAFTAEGDQVLENRYYSSENSRPRFLNKDVEADISLLEKEIESKRTCLAVFQQRIRSAENDSRENKRLLVDHRQHQKELQEEEKQENKLKMNMVKGSIHNQKENVEELKHILQEAEQNFAALKDKIDNIQEDAGAVEVRVCSFSDCLHCLPTHHGQPAMEDCYEMIAKASKIHPERIEVNRTFKSLETEMNHLRRKINSEREHIGDREEIIKQFQEAKEKYQDADSKVRSLKKFIKLLDDVMTQRHKTFLYFRRFLTLRCKYYFNSLLNQRSFSGKIEFDHKYEKLSITVQPGEGNKAALDDMKSLSGGERSFSTVCFILSLWSIAESPFRCLDEFDVFMDVINRRIAVDMMVNMADSQRYRQFILLSPQNMSSLPQSTLIRILRMPDPERGQTTLNFRRRREEDEDNN
uniref:Structural maintenance of chromosomes protein 6 n=1 Tax=Varanus komodoensis TaxID=61221 RepID=A0A8D2Q3W5_VARKO